MAIDEIDEEGLETGQRAVKVFILEDSEVLNDKEREYLADEVFSMYCDKKAETYVSLESDSGVIQGLISMSGDYTIIIREGRPDIVGMRFDVDLESRYGNQKLSFAVSDHKSIRPNNYFSLN